MESAMQFFASPRSGNVWKQLAYLMALLAVIFALAGCQMTPTQQYKFDKATYNGVAVGLAVYNVEKPFPPAIWTLIQQHEAAARQNLADAATWLAANPQFANTPGMSCPSLDPLNVTLNILSGYLPGGVVLVP